MASPDGNYICVTSNVNAAVAVVDVAAKHDPIVGGVANSTFMEGANLVAISRDPGPTRTLGVVDVGFSKGEPQVVGGVVDETARSYCWGLAVSPSGKRVFVTG